MKSSFIFDIVKVMIPTIMVVWYFIDFIFRNTFWKDNLTDPVWWCISLGLALTVPPFVVNNVYNGPTKDRWGGPFRIFLSLIIIQIAVIIFSFIEYGIRMAIFHLMSTLILEFLFYIILMKYAPPIKKEVDLTEWPEDN